MFARDVQAEMSRYLVMVSISNLGVGAATAITVVLLGVPDPLLWGVLAGILNFAPYVGPTLTAIGLAAQSELSDLAAGGRNG
jgi:predicted PurR-regulated permease PerM